MRSRLILAGVLGLVALMWVVIPIGRGSATASDGASSAESKPPAGAAADTKGESAETADAPGAGPGGAGAPGGAPGGPPPALVRVGEIRMESVQRTWDAVGRLREVRHAVVAAERGGRVMRIPVEEGDRVEVDKTVLVEVDPVWSKLSLRRAAADVDQAKAGIAEARARLENAQRDLRYLEDLLARNSARPKEVEDARATVLQAQAQLESTQAHHVSAEASAASIREELERMTVRAPFDGVIVRKLTEVGQWLNNGDPVVEIISVGGVDAVVNVPEQYVNQVHVGEPMVVMIEAIKLEQTGSVVAVVPTAATAARTFPVKVRLDDRDGVLKPGMSVLARVPTGVRTDSLTVPRDAVLRTAASATVWLNMNGIAMPADVRVLHGTGDRLVIEQVGGGPPLRPGMQVVIEGAERLFPTRPLNIAAEPTATPVAASRTAR